MTKKERFEHLLAVTSSKKFLGDKAYFLDIPFFICPYQAREANDMKKQISNLITQLKKRGIEVQHLNLYDICIELLDSEGDLEWIIKKEQSLTKDELRDYLQNTLDISQYLIPKIRTIIDKCEHEIIFVSGIGEVYPYIRAHSFLNNLQSTIKEKPMLMFFPGDYKHTVEKGSVLELFSRLKDDRYYRAFNIFDIKISSI